MKRIKKFADHIHDELCDAREYALDYLEVKADSRSSDASKYKEMANDELKHAGYFHDMAVAEINKVKAVYTPPVEMEELWDTEHRKYIEDMAEIRQFLAM